MKRIALVPLFAIGLLAANPIGVFLRCTGIDDPLAALKAVTSLGIDRVQVSRLPDRFYTPKGAKEFAGMLKETGITADAVVVVFAGESYRDRDAVLRTVGFRPVELREERLAYARKCVDFAAGIGAPIVTFHMGFLPENAEDPVYRSMLDAVSDVAAYAARKRITVSLETGQETGEQLARFLDRITVARVGVNFDPANLVIYGMESPARALQPLVSRVTSVHVKDAVLPEPPATMGREVRPGEGRAELKECFDILRKAGFKGPLIIENYVARGLKTEPLEELRRAKQFILAAAGPPETRREQFREVLHGVAIADPYRWLEDQESPETRRWIDAQNAYSRALLEPLPMRQPIAARLRALMDADALSAPIVRSGVYYFAKRGRGQELWSLWRRVNGADELLVDPATLSADMRTSVALMGVSHNGRVLGYAVRRGGEDESEIRFRNLQTGKDLGVSVPRHLNRGFAISSDGAQVYYTDHDREKGPRIRHLDLSSGRTVEVFGEGYGPDKFLSPMLAGDRNLVVTVSHGWARSDLFLKRLGGDAPAVAIVRDIEALFSATPAGPDRLLVQTDWKAPRRRVLAVDLNNAEPSAWAEIVPESRDAIQSIAVAGDRLFVRYLHDVAARIRVFTLSGKPVGDVDLPGLGSAGIAGEWRESEAVLSYSSFNQPGAIYLREARTGAQRLFHKPSVPFDPDRFAVKQVWYRSKDGTRIPMFLVHRKDLAPDGNLPVLLNGYGGFNVSITPSFSYSRAVWLEQGGVYAVPNLRGGGEFGEEWHRAGMLDKKQNVFDDFIAAAEWLIANRYTNPGRLAIEGTSNGGLLVGAALTQRPDLFRAVLCRYPDLDMVGYYRFKNNNKPALAEYGDASKPEHFRFLYAYSPYQKVKDGAKYPAVLLTTGDADTRVPPLQARKMAARLQAATSSGSPVLLLYDTLSGHAGSPPQSKVVEDASLELSFLFSQLNVSWRP